MSFSGRIAEVLFDEDMDLLRALEMSRLQFIQDSRLQPDVERSRLVGVHMSMKQLARIET